MSTEDNKKKASEVDLIAEYNSLLKEIPWENLQSLPKKLAKVGNLLPGLSFNPEDVDIIDPIKRVVSFVGVVVKRVRLSEKKQARLENEIEELKKKLG